ncbi:MAG: LysR family transcriptional regulator [Rhizobiales bacterium]|nr:LysR family transcriptional regulator [Hyphomicrobiales bacterium]
MRHSQLKAFHYVAICQGFSKAAKALSLSQPVISEHVRKLEQNYDVLLFVREKKRVSLTAKGEELFFLTKRLFEVHEQIEEFMSDNRSELNGTLRIIVDSAHHLVDKISQFKIHHPNVFISLKTGNTGEVFSKLRSYDADIGVVASLNPGNDMDALDLGHTKIVAFGSKAHKPNLKKKYSLKELSKMPLIFREVGSKTRQKIEEEAKRLNISLTPTIEADGREAVREIVASGAGIGFVSELEFGHDDRLVQIEIEDVHINMSEKLVFLKQRSDVRLILAFMRVANQNY